MGDHPMGIRERQQVVNIEIRPFRDADYEAVVEIVNAVFPDAPGTVEEWRYDDEHFDRSKFVMERHVAVDRFSGCMLGFAGLRHIPWNFHPQKFGVNIRVHPEHRRRGVGTRLWERLRESLQRHNAIAARTTVRENMADGLQFVARLGFNDVMRAWESRLDVGSCDLTRFRDDVTRAAASGATISSLAAERERDPQSPERLYAMDQEIGKDVPQPDRFTPVDFRLFVEHVVESPWAIPDAHFIAIVGGKYAGLSSLFKPKLGDWLNQGLTGVRRAYRGQGIATALKVKTVEYAKAHEIREIRTWNEINNAGILAINERFGFVRQPAWITYVNEF